MKTNLIHTCLSKKKGGLRISALYVFYCDMWAFSGLLNISEGSYIKIKYCQVILKAFHICLPNFDPSKCSLNKESNQFKILNPHFFGTPCSISTSPNTYIWSLTEQNILIFIFVRWQKNIKLEYFVWSNFRLTQKYGPMLVD